MAERTPPPWSWFSVLLPWRASFFVVGEAMFRYKLRTLLFVLPTLWLCGVAGAVVGMCVGWMTLPNSENLLFAVGWGTTVGLIPIGGMAAIVTEYGAVPRRFIVAASAAIAIACGLGPYIFAGITV